MEANTSTGGGGGVAVITVLIALTPGSPVREQEPAVLTRTDVAQSICDLANAFLPPHKWVVVNTFGISQHFSHGRF